MIKKTFASIVILSAVFLPVFTFAQDQKTPTEEPSVTKISINIPNPTNAGENLMEVLTTLLTKVIMPVAAVAVVIWIVWAGFQYILAQGNSTKIEKAHQQLLWSLIGAGILLGATGISLVVQKTIEALIKP